jgi:hypothetical protein
LTLGIARQAFLASLKELLRPAVIEPIGNPFTPTKLGNRIFAAQAGQNDPDFLFGGPFSAGCPADIPDVLFGRRRPLGFLSHLRSLRRYDEPEILHFSLTPICLVNADAGHRLKQSKSRRRKTPAPVDGTASPVETIDPETGELSS